MLAIPITVDLFLLIGCFAITGLIGFAFRSGQIRSLRSKVAVLEKGCSTHTPKFSSSSKNKVSLEEKLKGSSIPVIPIKVVSEEKAAEKMPDVAMRKKLLSQKSADKHS